MRLVDQAQVRGTARHEVHDTFCPDGQVSGARLMVDHPVVTEALLAVGVASGVAARWQAHSKPSGWSLLAGGLALLLLALVLLRCPLPARVTLRVTHLTIRGLWRRFQLRSASVLSVSVSGDTLSVLLRDGRLVTLSGLATQFAERARELLTAPAAGPEAFRLHGFPCRTRWGRLAARIPLLTGLLRTRLLVNDSELVFVTGPWVRRRPLATLVQLNVNGRGVEMGFSDATRLELTTFGGLHMRWHARIYHFNELIVRRIERTRRRALAAALSAYRANRGSSAAPTGSRAGAAG